MASTTRQKNKAYKPRRSLIDGAYIDLHDRSADVCPSRGTSIIYYTTINMHKMKALNTRTTNSIDQEVVGTKRHRSHHHTIQYVSNHFASDCLVGEAKQNWSQRPTPTRKPSFRPCCSRRLSLFRHGFNLERHGRHVWTLFPCATAAFQSKVHHLESLVLFGRGLQQVVQNS